jgi:hypothetical protein
MWRIARNRWRYGDRAASALGITDGPVVNEIVMHRGVPHVVEISVRLWDGLPRRGDPLAWAKRFRRAIFQPEP